MLKHISITEGIQSIAISKGDLGSCLLDPWRCVACGFPWSWWHCNLQGLLCYAGEFMAGQSSQSLGCGIRVAAFGSMLGPLLPTRFATDYYCVAQWIWTPSVFHVFGPFRNCLDGKQFATDTNVKQSVTCGYRPLTPGRCLNVDGD